MEDFVSNVLVLAGMVCLSGGIWFNHIPVSILGTTMVWVAFQKEG